MGFCKGAIKFKGALPFELAVRLNTYSFFTPLYEYKKGVMADFNSREREPLAPGRLPDEMQVLGGWSDAGTMKKIYTHIEQAGLLRAQNAMAAFFQNSAPSFDNSVEDVNKNVNETGKP